MGRDRDGGRKMHWAKPRHTARETLWASNGGDRGRHDREQGREVATDVVRGRARRCGRADAARGVDVAWPEERLNAGKRHGAADMGEPVPCGLPESTRAIEIMTCSG